MTRALLFMTLALVGMVACAPTTGVPSGTYIKPGHFQFQTVIPPDSTPGSGWRAVCIEASMSQGIVNGPTVASKIICRFEVGVPFSTLKGPVPLHKAQRIAAEASNTVAYEILTTTAPVSALVCKRFRDELRIVLGMTRLGFRVRSCTPGIRVVPFP